MKARKEPRKRRHSIRNKILVVILGIVLIQGIISIFPKILIRENIALSGHPILATQAVIKSMANEKKGWQNIYEIDLGEHAFGNGDSSAFWQIKSFGPIRYVTAFSPI